MTVTELLKRETEINEKDSSTDLFPKILVVGLSFNPIHGSGITLNNLFRKWPADRIAIASETISDTDHEISDHVYQIGFAENKRRFPFNLFQRKLRSGKSEKLKIAVNSNSGLPVPYHSRFPFLVKYYNTLLHFFGLFHYSRNLIVSENLKLWILNFKPDIVYTHANEFELMKLVLELKRKLNLRIATHIMDHYIDNYFNRLGLLYSYWQKKVEGTFSELIKQSDYCFSIGEEMNAAYSLKYGKTFSIFHNALELSTWRPYKRESYSKRSPFTILYAGRITIGTNECLLQVAEAIDRMEEKNDIRLHIQTTSTDPVLKKLSTYSFVFLAPVVPYEKIPEIISSADLLLLAHNFDAFTKTYFKYSFPTKAPEYMITGIPILLYSPKEVAVAKHALKYNWAFSLNTPDRGQLIAALRKFYNEESLRKKYGMVAYAFAINNYNLHEMEERFRTNLAKYTLH